MSRPLHITRRREKAPPDCLPLDELEVAAERWVLAAETAMRSPATRRGRRMIADHLLWFLRERGHTDVGEAAFAAFLAYVATGHLQPGGRWGEGLQEGRWGSAVTRPYEPVKPSTLRWYHVQMLSLTRFMRERKLIAGNPLEGIELPREQSEPIRPFTSAQITALLEAAKTLRTAERDRAILLFMLDTGCRSAELLALNVGDVDRRDKSCSVMGKGGKRRTVFFEVETLDALWALRTYKPDAPLFRTWFGPTRGSRMTKHNLQALFTELGERAGITGVRCSPHTMRHTFAINWLRSGGDVFALQRILGHSDLKTTQVYIALAEADLAAAHKSHSPVANLLRRR